LDSILVRLLNGPVLEPFEIRTNWSGFRMASLDRFNINGHKKYFIHHKTV
jgi:hypothetical protein